LMHPLGATRRSSDPSGRRYWLYGQRGRWADLAPHALAPMGRARCSCNAKACPEKLCASETQRRPRIEEEIMVLVLIDTGTGNRHMIFVPVKGGSQPGAPGAVLTHPRFAVRA